MYIVRNPQQPIRMISEGSCDTVMMLKIQLCITVINHF